MKTKHSASFCRKKLASSSLFVTYRKAFESVTGSALELRDQRSENGVSVPVPVGQAEPFFLVARKNPQQKSYLISGLLESFALQLGEEANRSVLTSEDSQPQVVTKAIQYLQSHLAEKIHLDDVAEELGLCSFQLCRLFKLHTGITMTEYVGRQRVECARRKLEVPTRQISSIAYEIGFSSLSQFNRNFLKYAGESPSQYRARLGQLEHCALAAL